MTRPEQAMSPEPGWLAAVHLHAADPTTDTSATPTSDVVAERIAGFAEELRELRRRAGSPPYRAMRMASGISGASLVRAATGRILPTWTVTQGFVLACGGDVAEWEPRWRQAAQEVHGTALVMATWQPVPGFPRPEPSEPLRLADFLGPRRDDVPATVPSPDDATTYDELRLELRRLKKASGFTYADVERNTDGRLSRHSAAAILDGVLPATGEQFVLLLKALGVRTDLNRWVHAWYRLDGGSLGAALRAETAGPAGPAAILLRLLPFALVLLVLAALVAVLLLLV
jgi:hypothetical protein